MRNILLTFLLCLVIVPVSAQRFGYVDTGYILENLPSYTQAQNTLKSQTQQWNQEIQNRQEAIEKRQAEFLNEKVLLTDDQIKKEQAEIDEEILEIKALQEKRYGQEGDLITLRKSLVKPIQDQVWAAVKQVAERRNYGFVFDKGSSLIMVYTDPKFDISFDVLKQLNPNAVQPQPQRAPASSAKKGTVPAPKGRTNTNRNTGKKGAPAQKVGDNSKERIFKR